MKKLHQAALDEAARLRLEVEKLSGLQAKHDEVCSALSQVEARHTAEMEAVKRQFGENSSRLGRMFDELAEKNRQQDRNIAAKDDKIKWYQEKINQLNSELSQSREEGDKKQLRINGLKDRVEQVKADKLRALDEIKELTETLARRGEEARRARIESQHCVETLQRELALNRSKNSELEGRVAGAEGQIVTLRNQNVEAERQLASLRGEQDATCAEAFQLGTEEVRVKITREHPEWDLSFLDIDSAEACTPEPEEAEYADFSDVDFDAILGPSEMEAPEGRPRSAGGGVPENMPKFETGEPSRVSPNVADETAKTASVSSP